MRLHPASLALAATLLWSLSTHALSKVTGAMLLHDCRAAVKSTDISPRLTLEEDRAADRCIGYTQGVMDSNAFWHTIDERDHNKMVHYCIDLGASTEQIIRIVVKYLEENPKELSENGWVCFQAALLRSFPC